MLKKTIKYEDYFGNERSGDFYFHLTKAELVEWLTTSGDYTIDKMFEQLINAGNGKEIIAIFKELIYRSYGVISLDGKRFDKSEAVKKEFVESEAYSVLFMELITDTEKAMEFLTGVMPSDLAGEVEKAFKENPDGFTSDFKKYIPSSGGATNFPV